MQTATIMLNIAGDTGTQIPKYNVTPAEVRVLQVIHGDDAVSDIVVNDEPATDDDGNGGKRRRNSRQERARLSQVYSQRQPDGSTRSPAVDMLFPGEAARLYETFDEAFDIDGEHSHMFREVDSRPAKAAAQPVPADAPATVDDHASMTVAQLKAHADEQGIDLTGASKKDEIISKIVEAKQQGQTDSDDEDDGIGDMPAGDENLFQ